MEMRGESSSPPFRWNRQHILSSRDAHTSSDRRHALRSNDKFRRDVDVTNSITQKINLVTLRFSSQLVATRNSTQTTDLLLFPINRRRSVIECNDERNKMINDGKRSKSHRHKSIGSIETRRWSGGWCAHWFIYRFPQNSKIETTSQAHFRLDIASFDGMRKPHSSTYSPICIFDGFYALPAMQPTISGRLIFQHIYLSTHKSNK